MDELGIIITGVAGAVALLLRALTVRYSPGDDEDETDSIEVATSDTSGGGHSQSLEETITAEFTHNPGDSDIKVTAHGTSKQPYSTGRNKSDVRKKSPAQCDHCGAVNESDKGRCWQCGSSPNSALSKDQITTVNKKLREHSTDRSFRVKKGDDPSPHPSPNPLTDSGENDPSHPSEDDLRTDKNDINNDEIHPIHKRIGALFGWIDKWRSLTSTHMRSMAITAFFAALVWGISIIYGTFRFGTSGLIALIGASLIAVSSAALAALFFLAPGKGTSITMGYPMVMNTVLLPPLVIAFHEPALSMVWHHSDQFAAYLLDTFLVYGDINTHLRENYSMTEELFLLMWFAIAFPLGWITGTSVYSVKQLVNNLKNNKGGNHISEQDT